MELMTNELRDCLEEILHAYGETYPIPPTNKRLKNALDNGWLMLNRIPGGKKLTEKLQMERKEERYNSSMGLWLGTVLGLLGGALGMQALVLTDPKIYPSYLISIFCILIFLGGIAAVWSLFRICYFKYKISKLSSER